MEVYALQCQDCGDIIYSRARHDFRNCTCGKIFVDGGFDYCRRGFTDKPPKGVTKRIKASKQQMYDDWNNKVDKYGLIRTKIK